LDAEAGAMLLNEKKWMRENGRERGELALGISPGCSRVTEKKLLACTLWPMACMHQIIKYLLVSLIVSLIVNLLYCLATC
jgi:hypothetical protein